MPPQTRAAFLNSLSRTESESLLNDWRFWAHDAQLPPEGSWRFWLFMGGRGAGKTWAAANWIQECVGAGRAGRVALIGCSLLDVREVMIEGPSGLRAIAQNGQKPAYKPSRRTLEWPNGAVGLVFSSADPDSLRGPQFDLGWGDEIAAWDYPERTLRTFELGLRLGDHPRAVFTTTPKPIKLMRDLVAKAEKGDVALTHATSTANAGNLAPGFLSTIQEQYAGTRFAAQELEGVLLDAEDQSSLWTEASLATARAKYAPVPDFPGFRLVIGLDPSVSENARGCECGIVLAALPLNGDTRPAMVLADRSLKARRPSVWAAEVAKLCALFPVAEIIAEANQGGGLVRGALNTALDAIANKPLIRLVTARQSKFVRAAPIAAFYDQHRIAHAPGLSGLEAQMLGFGEHTTISPDRVDALVWALSDLIDPGGRARLRCL